MPFVDDVVVGSRWRRVLPAVLGLLVVLFLGAGAYAVGQVSLAAAEQERLDQRSRLVEDLNASTSEFYDPAQIRVVVDTLPFSPADAERDRVLLEQVGATSFGEPNESVALVRRDGTTLASLPGSTEIPIADLGSSWQQALDGQPTVTDVFEIDGEASRAVLVPVGGSPPWGVLVAVLSDLAGTYFAEQLGSLGLGPGGLVTVDPKGVEIYGWTPATVGQVVVDPNRLPVGQQGQSVTWASGGVTNVAAWQPDTGYSSVFQQETSLLFADLRAQQRERDVVVTVVVASAVAALVVFGLYRELTARRQRDRVSQMLDGVGDLVLLLGPQHEVRFASPAAKALLGTDPAALIGRPLLDLVDPADVDGVKRLLSGVDRGPLLDVRLRTGEGGHGWFDLDRRDLSHDPWLSGAVVTGHDAQERRSLQEEVARRAHHDPLTGLGNRETFNERLDSAAAGAAATGVSCGVLFVDLDGFKPVNDSYGHAVGDRVLVELATRMSTLIGNEAVVCRLGGDEFSVVEFDTDPDQARRVAEAFVEVLSAPVVAGDLVVTLTASVGVAVSAPGAPDPVQLRRVADSAMYRAKRAGGGRAFVVTGVGAASGYATAPNRHENGRDGTGREGTEREGTGERDGAESPPHPEPGSARSRRRRWARLWSLAASVLVLAVVIGVGWWQQTRATDVARERRLAEREELASNLAGLASVSRNSEALGPAVTGARWSVTDLAGDQAVLRQVLNSSDSPAGNVAALLDASGAVLASVPPGTPVPVGTDSELWRSVLAGNVRESQIVAFGGVQRIYSFVPVNLDDGSRGVVMFGNSTEAGRTRQLAETLGTLGVGPGGFSVVDASGRVGYSWSPQQVGQILVASADLAALPSGSAARPVAPAPGSGADDRSDVLLAARAPGSPGYFLVLQQPAAAFYAGVREGQTALNGALAAIVVISVVGVAWSNDRREASVRRGEARLDAFLDGTHDLIVRTGRDGRITFVTSAAERLLGYRPVDLVGRQLVELAHPDDEGRLRECLARPGRSELDDVRLRRAAEAYLWFGVSCAPLPGKGRRKGGGDGRKVVTCHEISVRKRLRDQLSYQADHDALTGLRNRAVLDRRVAELTATDEAGAPSQELAVLFVDLDFFKPVNDTYGHEVGDKLLQVVGARLQAAAREDDLVCRVGGDEFAILLEGADPGFAEEVAGRVLEAVQRPVLVEGLELQIGATVGVATADGDEERAEATLRHADQAMYQAKQAGRGRFVTYPGRTDPA